MARLFVIILTVFQAAGAFAAKFESCSLPQHLEKIEEVRRLLKEQGPTRHFAFYELRKGRNIVGYIPIYNLKGQNRIAKILICSDFKTDHLFARGRATTIAGWIPANRSQILKLKNDLYEKDATAEVHTKMYNDNNLIIGLMSRNLADDSYFKDKAVLNIELRTSL